MFLRGSQTFFRFIFLMSFFIVGLIVMPTLAIESREILSLSLEAQFQVNIEGIKETQIYLEEKTHTIRVKLIYQKPNFSYMLYLAPFYLKGRKIMDDGRLRIEYILDRNKFNLFPSPNSFWAKKRKRENLNLVFASYNITQLPDEDIAGRETYVLSLTPKYSGNPGLKIWIDKKTFLVLKQERYNSEGKLVVSSAFTEIHFGKRISPEELNGMPKSLEKRELPSRRIIYNLQKLREEIKFPLSFPGYLPAGYNFQEAILLNDGRRVALTYTNGLGTIVFFQSPAVNIKIRGHREIFFKKKLGQLQSSIGAKTLVWTGEKKTFVLIADISEEELAKIAESIE